MTAAALFNDLTSRHFNLRAENEALFVVPSGLLTSEDQRAIRAHKPELLAFLTSPMPLPELREDGTLRIPLSTHPMFQYWAGGQSLWETLAELNAPLAAWRRYARHNPALFETCHECNTETIFGNGFWACATCGFYKETL